MKMEKETKEKLMTIKRLLATFDNENLVILVKMAIDEVFLRTKIGEKLRGVR